MKRKVFNWVRVLLCLVLGVIVIFCVSTVTMSYIGETPYNALGKIPVIVRSVDPVSELPFNRNDLAIFDVVRDDDNIKGGDIICLSGVDVETVVEHNQKEDYFVVGDGSEIVNREDIVGVYRSYIPLLGGVLFFIGSNFDTIMIMSCIIVAVYFLLRKDKYVR